jgi:hypothetical protein
MYVYRIKSPGMKMNEQTRYLLTITAAFALIGTAAQASAATAMAKPIKAAAMSCEDFLALDDVTQPQVVYWSEGLTRSGKPEDAVFDVERTNRLVPVLIEDCTKEPKAAYLPKVKAALKKSP